MDSDIPAPPEELIGLGMRLRYIETLPGDVRLGFVPSLRFHIYTSAGEHAGRIHLRVGDTPHVRWYAGHVGYEVYEEYRGENLALRACLALAPFARDVAASHVITCDPDNTPSMRTIERLAVLFLGEVEVPPEDPQYASGSRHKRRYRWLP
ncbi:MAG: GNAT family N-acetyltransferase [Verrucomicrobiales bacterium]|nr:GNAT family N-acetyltransferase [Verrucomicrobiales bacterium]